MSKRKLEAVAYDTDGQVKPIDQYKAKAEAVEPKETVEAVTDAPVAPVNAWRMRLKGDEGEYRSIVADSVEDAIRAFNAGASKVVTFDRLEIIAPAVSEVL